MTEITEVPLVNTLTLTSQNEPLRVCKNCGLKAYTTTDLDLFAKNRGCLYDRLPYCKKCKAITNRKEYHENKEKRRKSAKKYYYSHQEEEKKSSLEYYHKNKELSFLYKRPYGYLRGDGCCLWPDCYEINPWMLNQHHSWEKTDPAFTITLCENHHAPLTRGVPAVLEFNFKLEK